ncbi:conserved hypothetical protein [Hirschia baltica ATCC 49814]|uniref:JmjC domain-containing protein n=1 Tax=Hirschia baltica (strain ATCC 49814 / DSM 5838 / IFAM 1418) TaxID=582402 RepID=C6XJJ9_HIRBI|nr:conserved hypothetical protein [Hirschia baltica ATCC 49814]
MLFKWPEDTSVCFSKEVIAGEHDEHLSEKYSDDGLADLLDRYPRENMGIYTFPAHSEGRVKAIHGRADNLSGAELLEAVKRGQIWLNLRAVSKYLPEYADVRNKLFSQLDSAAGIKTLKQDIGVLISSPDIHVHYHLDIPFVCLVQVRGEKYVSLYPPHEPFATANQIEAVVLREQEEEMDFKYSFDEHVSKVHMKPGVAITWPQNAPHRVQNGNMMNVSLSCEYMTASGLLKANAMYTNGKLRRRFGMNPSIPQNTGAAVMLKAVVARALKIQKKPTVKKVTPITFEIDKNTLEVRRIDESSNV